VSEAPAPERIHRDDRAIVITWAPGHVGTYAARALRLNCHCATCRDEFTGRLTLDPGSVPEHVRPEQVSLVGNYAIRIRWSDGHDTGIYTYEYLLSLCPCERCMRERAQRQEQEERQQGLGR
jgi:ATP-binding protein involved in chromosome partitioning